jgi:hypothetical protein
MSLASVARCLPVGLRLSVVHRYGTLQKNRSLTSAHATSAALSDSYLKSRGAPETCLHAQDGRVLGPWLFGLWRKVSRAVNRCLTWIVAAALSIIALCTIPAQLPPACSVCHPASHMASITASRTSRIQDFRKTAHYRIQKARFAWSWSGTS